MSTRLSRQIKPISYVKAHAAEVIRDLSEGREPLIVTQNGEARAVIQDIESYEQTQDFVLSAIGWQPTQPKQVLMEET